MRAASNPDSLIRPAARLLAPCLAALLTCWVAPPPVRGEEQTLNRVVLRVNNEIFTLFDYQELKNEQVQRIMRAPDASPEQRQELLGQVGRMIMKQVFEDLLLQSRATQMGLRVDDVEVEESLAEIRERNGFETRADFERALSTAGMTIDVLREQTSKQLLMQKVMGREVWSQIEIGPEELRAYYRNHRDEFLVSEERRLEEVIILESSGRGEESMQQLAGQVRELLGRGEANSETLASWRDEGLTTGVIELGWLKAEELEETLARVAWALEPGEVSPPVAARGGLHVIRLLERKEEQVRPFEEVEEQILQRERVVRFEKEARTYMGKLENTAYIRESLPPDAVGYRALGDAYEEEPEFDFFAAPPAEDPALEEPAPPEPPSRP